MSDQYIHEPMLDMFIFETSQLIGQLEQSILASENFGSYEQDAINEIFRIMHTIKGSSAMMMFNNISILAHAIEDLFYFLREDKPHVIDYSSLSDLILEGVDFIKLEVEKIKNGDNADGNALNLIDSLKSFLSLLRQNNHTSSIAEVYSADPKKQQYYIEKNKNFSSETSNIFHALIHFEEGCEMENIRAFTIIENLKDIATELRYTPEDIFDNDDSTAFIRKEGFKVYFHSKYAYEKIREFFMRTVFLKSLELTQLEDNNILGSFSAQETVAAQNPSIELPDASNLDEGKKEYIQKEASSASTRQNIISVSVSKLDKLMDLVGEMVIAEAMVIQNPDLNGLLLDNFHKAARLLNKITNEIQDTVMSIRMVPLSATFQKMHRIVRDMCKKLNKEVTLEILGEETEVDKNIIEHISDPLMHLVRNALDHGIEPQHDRLTRGKSQRGTITLEAKNAGSDVLIVIKDDGKGLNKEKLLEKAKENNLLYKPEEDMSDKDIFNLIFLPGFSTKDSITEFSGRGVGMDVVMKNIETVGGFISVDSILDVGTTITLKIPLTLAIIDGMNIAVGNSRYTIPTISIKESFRPQEKDLITDPQGHEMIMVRGECYPILRLHQYYKVQTPIHHFTDGIIIMLEQDAKTLCIFADKLLGQQQVVVKALPEYIKKFKKIRGLAGCTLLGDGSISLILDITGLLNL